MMNILLAIFGIEMGADGWTTTQVLRFGGYEEMHWIALLMKKIGVVPALLVAKVLPIAAVSYALYVHQMPWQLLAGLEVLYVAVIVNNWKALQRQKGVK